MTYLECWVMLPTMSLKGHSLWIFWTRHFVVLVTYFGKPTSANPILRWMPAHWEDGFRSLSSDGRTGGFEIFQGGTVDVGGSRQDRRSKNPTDEVFRVTWTAWGAAKPPCFDNKRWYCAQSFLCTISSLHLTGPFHDHLFHYFVLFCSGVILLVLCSKCL